MQEQWKTIKGFEYYSISNYGQVKSYRTDKEKILKGSVSVKGYKQFEVNGRTYGGHVLVAMAFLGHKPDKMNIVVDHIDNNRLNNDISNLQLISQRSNSHRLQERYQSKFKGVCVARKKWRSRIYINGKQKFLGSFNCEFKAHVEYLKAVKSIEC